MLFRSDRKSTRLNSSHTIISYALPIRSEEHTSELQSHDNLVCRLLLEKKKHNSRRVPRHPLAPARALPGHTALRARGVPRRRSPPPAGPGGPRCVGWGSCFFLNNTAPPKFSPFPPPAPFPF